MSVYWKEKGKDSLELAEVLKENDALVEEFVSIKNLC